MPVAYEPKRAAAAPLKNLLNGYENYSRAAAGTAFPPGHRGRPGRTRGLVSRYHAARDRPRSPAESVITYILIHEREEGLIGG